MRTPAPLPDVPALAVSMKRLYARCAQVQAKKIPAGQAPDSAEATAGSPSPVAPSGPPEVPRPEGLEWIPPKRNTDGTATTVTLDGRYAVLRTPKEPPFRYIVFQLEGGSRFVIGSADHAEPARQLAQAHAERR